MARSLTFVGLVVLLGCQPAAEPARAELAEMQEQVNDLQERLDALEQRGSPTDERPADMRVIEAGLITATSVEATIMKAAAIRVENTGGDAAIMKTDDGGISLLLQSNGNSVMISADPEGPVIRMLDAQGRARVVRP